MTSMRTKNSYDTLIYDFLTNILVECPSCKGKAVVKMFGIRPTDEEEEKVSLTCTSCGYNRRLVDKEAPVLMVTSRNVIRGRVMRIGGMIDPYFSIPVYLKADCCNYTLWAYNYEHLEFLRQHVDAKLRERNTVETRNKSLGSRLPRWMTSKKNRAAVLKAIEQLKNK